MSPNIYTPCSACGASLSDSEWRHHLRVCPSCGAYQPLGAHERLDLVLDKGSKSELDADLFGNDPLSFDGYADKLAGLQKKTNLTEAVVTALGEIEHMPVVVGVMDSRFLMGSMGIAVGEKITRAVELAQEKRLPLILFCASGGARMQEGIYSLMQMVKTSAAVADFQADGGLYISVLTHPTTGGVIASFASLGDIMLAEPGALIGFTGPRVIEQTIGQRLPEGFQRSEFQMEHGFVDQIVKRGDMRAVLAKLLRLHDCGVNNR